MSFTLQFQYNASLLAFFFKTTFGSHNLHSVEILQFVTKVRTDMEKKAFRFSAPHAWNKLQADIKHHNVFNLNEYKARWWNRCGPGCLATLFFVEFLCCTFTCLYVYCYLSVYIPPQADTNVALSEQYKSMNTLESRHPNLYLGILIRQNWQEQQKWKYHQKSTTNTYPVAYEANRNGCGQWQRGIPSSPVHDHIPTFLLSFVRLFV